MGNPIWAFSFLLFWVLFYTGGLANNLQDLNTLVQNEAFKELYQKKTGILYNVSVPSFQYGVTAQVIRLRVGSLRRRGVNINEFTIPKGATVEGNPRSVVMVYKNFGHNYSYFPTMGYKFVAPVVGIQVYNASVTKEGEYPPELKLIVKGNPISINIPVYADSTLTPSCALFNSTGVLTSISKMDSPTKICITSQLGDFSLIIPTKATAPSPSLAPESPMVVRKREQGSNKWKFAAGAAGGGTVSMLVLFLVAVWGRKEADKAKISKMERQADNEETLQTSLIGNSRAPTAASTRTRPVLENEDST
ncbi:hypothetical protein SUGI_0609980 [Cryptomeria japonica]|uniref:Uncharacterized protein n=1 Tax=Cryptomeria japonica TaxID=3369 RepID=A0A1V1G3A1_CRYJA|nr:uncharacterized protein LOC131077311 [Cryptomeria japonica]BAX09108.1 protein of unknown function DUF1191 [Cryptomeria japonica]GLJ30762.1 hypothetical protein SUGI_0609980 [Cryptomeria japonica]